MFTPKVSIPPSPRPQHDLYFQRLLSKKVSFFSQFSLVQPVDVIANRPFKDKVRRVFVGQLHKSFEVYLVKFQPAQ